MKAKSAPPCLLYKLRVLICLALLCTMPISARANTITVTNTNDSGPGSLRQALVDANDGDTINFDPVLVGQSITLTSAELVIDNSITISGPGLDFLSVRATNQFFRIFHVMPGHAVTIDGLTIGPNSYCDSGCGIFNDQATLTVSNCAVHGNTARDGAAGILSGGSVTIMNSSVTGNTVLYSGSGAGIVSGGSLTIMNSRISGNFAGKGIFNGGGIAASGTVTISNSTISGNSVTVSGGGIYNTGAATITNSTISGNFAGGGYPFPNGPGFGGGIYNSSDAMLTITNSTVSGNSVLTTDSGPGCGGGIGNSGPLQIANTTISDNSATNGGGICNGSALEIESTILNAGASGQNIFNDGGTIASNGYNVSSDDGSGYLTGTGDQTNTDPILGPLQDNGGPTRTHRPFPGSPAIDAGDPGFTPPPFYDQRGPGFDRVVNGRIDIGSFEVQEGKPPPPSPTPTPTLTPTPTPRPSPTPRSRPSPPPRPTPR
jgi:hypothetical protein